MKITVNEKIDLKADRKKDQFLADMKKARTSNGWEVVEDGWASEGEVKGLYSVYCSEETELPDIIPDSQMEAIADILREAVSKDPTVRKYSDYIKADAFFDGGVYVNVSFDPTEELWQEELSDAEYVWKKVANAMASIAERYRSRGAELEKQTQGKGESKAAPKKAEAEYCINCGALCKHPVHSGAYVFCSQGCYFDFLEHEDIVESKKGEGWTQNRITESDARKKARALQKQGKFDQLFHEIATATSYVQNTLANSSPDVKDNALNSSEKKIVAKAVLAQIAEQFGYRLID